MVQAHRFVPQEAFRKLHYSKGRGAAQLPAFGYFPYSYCGGFCTVSSSGRKASSAT